MKPSKILNSIILIILLIQSAHGQDWPKIYGDNVNAYVKIVLENYDHGFYICGDILANTSTFRYAWIIKTDINGNDLWNKKYGNSLFQNYLGSCTKTADQGLIACGNTTIVDPQFDPFFFKLNVCGEVEWCTILLSEGYNDASGVIAVEDGYIGMLRYFRSDSMYSRISLIKLNLEGEPLWIQYLVQEDSLISNEEGLFINLTSDNNFLVSGSAYNPTYHPYWILADTSGLQVWNLSWDNLVGQAHRLVEKDTGIYYSTCWGIDSTGLQSPILLKFDNEGNPIEMHYLMGDTIGAGSATTIDVLNDTCLAVGLAWKDTSYPGTGHVEIFLTDTLGQISARYHLLNEYQEVTGIIKTFDNKLIVVGSYVVDDNWDIYLWKMNANLEDDTLYTQPLTYDSLCPYDIQSDTVDLDCDLFVNIDELPTKEEYESKVKISPNPAHDWVAMTMPDVAAAGKVQVVVYDVYGREAGKRGSGDKVPVNRMVVLDVSGYLPGMYVVVVTDGKGRRYSGKIIVR